MGLLLLKSDGDLKALQLGCCGFALWFSRYISIVRQRKQLEGVDIPDPPWIIWFMGSRSPHEAPAEESRPTKPLKRRTRDAVIHRNLNR